jgi:hypothetical protein
MTSKSARANDPAEVYKNRGNMIPFQVQADGECTIGIDFEQLRRLPSFGRG